MVLLYLYPQSVLQTIDIEALFIIKCLVLDY